MFIPETAPTHAEPKKKSTRCCDPAPVLQHDTRPASSTALSVRLAAHLTKLRSPQSTISSFRLKSSVPLRPLLSPSILSPPLLMISTREQQKRKRPRLEREPGESLFASFFSSFYSSSSSSVSSPSSADDNNSSMEALPQCSLDYDARDLHRVSATGVDNRQNDLLVRVARTAAATANVVFFPGDVQEFHDAMLLGAHAEYALYSFEHTAELLADKFGDDANVWIVRPSRFQFGAFACFDGFVETNKFGAATGYTTSGSAVEQLVGLMEDARVTLEQERVEVSTLLPVHLVGFSKGGVVLNQLATEIATRWHPSRDSNNNNNNNNEDDNNGTADGSIAPLCQQFASMVASIHWLDSGNGSKPGAVPFDEQTLLGLSSCRSLQLCVHVTPYQFESRERPWIKNEILQLIATMARLDVHVPLLRYHENEAATLASHFQILDDFYLPAASSTKTGQTHSPEVTLCPVPFQKRALSLS